MKKQYDYVLGLQLMPNEDLLRENESIGSLLPHLENQYPVYKNKIMKISNEMQKRGLMAINAAS